MANHACYNSYLPRVLLQLAPVRDKLYVCMCMYIFIHQTWIFTKNYTVIMKIIIYSVEISSPIGIVSNSEVVNLR